MRFTHYWRRPKTLAPDIFALLVEDAKKINALLSKQDLTILIRNGNGTGNPVFRTDLCIRFNGDSATGMHYETFYLQQELTTDRFDSPDDNGLYFCFCKTSFGSPNPYNILVVAVLFAAKYHFGKDFVFASDGFAADLTPGYNLWREACNPTGEKIGIHDLVEA